MDKLKKTFNNFVKTFHNLEKASLIFFLSLMIIVSFLQIILRTFFKAVEWFDPLVRYSVLWTGMIAASIATYQHKHIKIDIIGKFAKGKLKSIVLFTTNLFASVVSALLCYASAAYIINFEMTSTDPAPFLSIPRWVLLLVMPICFGTISLRFLFRVGQKIYNIIKNIEEHEDETSEFDADDVESNTTN